MTIQKIGNWLTITVIFALLVPVLVQDGMFLDGITYSAISKNLSNGIGSFWQPHYTQTLAPNFYGHPPLVFGLQALFFSLLGDGIYVERLYSFLTALLSAWGIGLCWQLFFPKTNLKQFTWLPILLWITIPLVAWSYANNMLENSLSVFAIFAVCAYTKSVIQLKKRYLLLGSLLVILSFLCKGFVGLFPIIAPLYLILIGWIQKKYLTFIYVILAFIFPFILFFLIILLIPESKVNILAYLDTQLLPALQNELELTTSNRLSILGKLFVKLLPPVLLLIMCAFWYWRKKGEFIAPFLRESIYFLLIGISASLPLIIVLKQRSFYLVPAIPFYVLAISFLLQPYLSHWLSGTSNAMRKNIQVITIIALLGVILFSISKIGDFSRDEQIIKDIHLIAKEVTNESIIGTTPDLWYDWKLHAYFSRIAYLSLAHENVYEYDYFLSEKGKNVDVKLLELYRPVHLNLGKYVLYEKR